MKPSPRRLLVAGGLALAVPSLTFAHTGHGSVEGLIAGCAHPFAGWDHLLATLAVGLWAAQLGGRARWLMPAAFLAVLALGAALGLQGVVTRGIEPMLLGSVLVLGLLIARAVRLPLPAGAALVSLFALFHGAAHGAEMPLASNVVGYATGFLLSTAALQLAGLAAGRLSARATRVLGGVVALAGLLLAVG